MKIAKFLLASLLTVAIAGGTYASFIAKGPVKIFWKSSPTACANFLLVSTASITNELEGGPILSKTQATIADTEPPTCTLTVYYITEG